MNFVSLEQLTKDSEALGLSIGALDKAAYVLGIPRSGMIPAAIVATQNDLPLVIDYQDAKGMADKKGFLVDDSLYAGGAMARASEQLARIGVYPTRCVVYVAPESKHKVDMFVKEVPMPRVFQWNIWKHPILEHTLCDIDGVVCDDPIAPEEIKYLDYLHHLAMVPIKYRPAKVCGFVTHRLSRYEDVTRRWLAMRKIPFGNLTMWNGSLADRRKHKYGEWKGEIYRDCKSAKLFLESSSAQAGIIAMVACKPVLCIGDWRMY